MKLFNIQNFSLGTSLPMIVLCLFQSFQANAQLPDFTLDVVKTDANCPGNGTLTFNVANTTDGATILFTVYLQPDLTTPISVSGSNFLDGLSAGTYTVIATQELGAEASEPEEVEITIEDIVEPLAFFVSPNNQGCDEGGQLIVTATEGYPAQYEIINGPVTVPLQESNVFSGLPAGTYVIRVFDECGLGDVTTYTLLLSDEAPTISEPEYESVITTDCDTAIVTNTISYGEGIAVTYPLTIEYVMTPDNGDPPTVITETFNTGDPIMLAVSQEFPLDVQFTYTITITDACNTFQTAAMNVNPAPSIDANVEEIPPCGGHYLRLGITNFMPPYTVNFINPPAGFNPTDYNGSHPGPFQDESITYGSDDLAIPEGTYEIEVTDACGRMGTVTVVVEDEVPEPVVASRNNGCFSEFGRFSVAIPDRDIVFAQIVIAPATYTETLPDDVSGFINTNGRLVVTDLPIGEYTVEVTDECGQDYTIVVVVPEFVLQGFSGTGMADCTAGSGTLTVNSGNGALVSLELTDAPQEYIDGLGITLPQDMTASLAENGQLFMDGLPIGDYTFEGVDICGIEGSVTVTVPQTQPPGTAFQIVRNCGSYNIVLNDGVIPHLGDPPTYWLQKRLNADTDTWGHPETNTVYPEGSEPNEDNSIELINGQTLFNLQYEGRFRIIKYFETASSEEDIKTCLGDLGEFDYVDGVVVQGVYDISCESPGDIYVFATGMPPFTYEIIEKDGVPFMVNNGNNSIFSGLAPGVYTFRVTDACGFVGPYTINISTLPDLAAATDPGDQLICVEAGVPEFAEFELSALDEAILDQQSPDLYTVSYHLSAADAQTGDNPLPEFYTNTNNPQTIYARVVHDHITLCSAMVSFGLQVSNYPDLNMAAEARYCEGEDTVTLTADAGFDSYLWSTGATTQSITVNGAGTYSVDVSIIYGSGICTSTAEIVVSPSGPPTSVEIETGDWTANSNTITIVAIGPGNYEYSLDGINYQESPVFDDLPVGLYTIYINDINGCGVVPMEVVLLNYPKFFTPNGDGINETWRIPLSYHEPNMEVRIFDRYGKFITAFGPFAPGWDGTYNGERLPSTDYWFVVTRQDGKIHRGHFSMIR